MVLWCLFLALLFYLYILNWNEYDESAGCSMFLSCNCLNVSDAICNAIQGTKTHKVTINIQLHSWIQMEIAKSCSVDIFSSPEIVNMSWVFSLSDHVCPWKFRLCRMWLMWRRHCNMVSPRYIFGFAQKRRMPKCGKFWQTIRFWGLRSDCKNDVLIRSAVFPGQNALLQRPKNRARGWAAIFFIKPETPPFCSFSDPTKWHDVQNKDSRTQSQKNNFAGRNAGGFQLVKLTKWPGNGTIWLYTPQQSNMIMKKSLKLETYINEKTYL